MNRHIFSTNTGLLFIIFCDGTTSKYAASRDGGVSWTVNALAGTCASGSDESIWYDNQFIYIVHSKGSNTLCGATGQQICFTTGTISGTSITLAAWQAVSIADANNITPNCSTLDCLPTITVDSNSNIWIAAHNLTGPIGIAKCSCTGQQTWVNASGFPKDLAGQQPGGLSLIPLTAGKVVLISPNNAVTNLQFDSWTGSAWQTRITTSGGIFVGGPGQGCYDAIGVGDDIQLVYSTLSIGFISSTQYHFGTNSLDPASTISTATPGSIVLCPTITYDQSITTYYSFYNVGNGGLFYFSTLPLGKTQWSIGTPWVSGETNFPPGDTNPIPSLMSSYYAVPPAPGLLGQDLIPVSWITGTGPYNIRFQSLTVNQLPYTPGGTTTPSGQLQSVPGPGGVAVPPQLADQKVLGFIMIVAGLIAGSSIQLTRRKDE